MRKSLRNIISILIFILFVSSLQSSNETAKLHVIVYGVRNSNGWVVCHLYNNPDGFPTDSKKAFLLLDDTHIKNGQAEFLFENLPYGVYAFTIHHDENVNKKMDTNWLGLPIEGWACSNNTKGFLGVGPPSFEKSKFTINSPYVEQKVTMNY